MKELCNHANLESVVKIGDMCSKDGEGWSTKALPYVWSMVVGCVRIDGVFQCKDCNKKIRILSLSEM